MATVTIEGTGSSVLLARGDRRTVQLTPVVQRRIDRGYFVEISRSEDAPSAGTHESGIANPDSATVLTGIAGPLDPSSLGPLQINPAVGSEPVVLAEVQGPVTEAEAESAAKAKKGTVAADG